MRVARAQRRPAELDKVLGPALGGIEQRSAEDAAMALFALKNNNDAASHNSVSASIILGGLMDPVSCVESIIEKTGALPESRTVMSLIPSQAERDSAGFVAIGILGHERAFNGKSDASTG